MKTRNILRQAMTVRTRTQLRLLKGKYERSINHLSIPLQDSCLATWDRLTPRPMTLAA